VNEVQDAFQKLSDGFQKKFLEIIDQFQMLRNDISKTNGDHQNIVDIYTNLEVQIKTLRDE